jgi:hypothetical protein
MACAGDISVEGVHGMMAGKLKGTVTKDHRLELTIPPSVPPGEVEVIVLHSEPPPGPRARGYKQAATFHPAAGLGADRQDIGDTITFVSQLGQRSETRHDASQ